MNKTIAIKLAMAQIASDYEKGRICDQLVKAVGRANAYKAIKGGYQLKDQLIKEICHQIATQHNTGFRFWWTAPNEFIREVVLENEYGNTTRWIERADDIAVVYFETKINGQLVQISFHNPNLTYKTWEPGCKSFKSKWTREGNISACLKLLNVS